MLSSGLGKRTNMARKIRKTLRSHRTASGPGTQRPGALTVALLWESNVAPLRVFVYDGDRSSTSPQRLTDIHLLSHQKRSGAVHLGQRFPTARVHLLTIRADIHDVSAIISVPDSRTSAEGGGPDDSSAALNDDTDEDRDTRGEFAVDEACWIYEQLRYVELRPLVSRPTSSKLITRSQDGSRRTFLIP